MSRHAVDTRPVDTRRPLRVGALALAALMWVTACATGAPSGGGLDEEDTGDSEAIFSNLPTDFQPVRVSDSELTAALAKFWLQVPLRVSTACLPLYVGRKLVLASAPLSGEAWQSDVAQSYGRFCERRGTPGDCLTLFDDGPRLQADDKRSIALALAVGPALEGVDAEVRAMLNPTRVLATLSFTITVYMSLLLAPEPVTKGVALAFSVLMWGYLGWEFFDLLRAYAQLYEDAPQASNFAELREIGERFGHVIGPNSVRILVMVATAAIGETAALMSKGPKLPGFGQASRTVEANTGLRLMDTATGTERVIFSVNEGTIRVVLPVNAASMTARNGGGGRSALKPEENTKGGRILAGGHRAFSSFRAFKRQMGKAGEGLEWHHLVEKHKFNIKRFGAEAIHNTENVIPLEKDLHTRVSAFYSSKNFDVTSSYGLTVREWIRTQSYEAQRSFGLLVIKKIRSGEW
ncbi:MAG TPA: hypothetical protein VFZ09_30600 [Archangium sp.]|uniref:SitA5 family polymorphic toxin n=1 Tax=Archangium sp. TaxID=1872627 RepID=UPI002E35CCC3|nr:hypothetical protein [Archangium sp.]HEX5750617.1 hypothetical protein [Archangium sp.]